MPFPHVWRRPFSRGVRSRRLQNERQVPAASFSKSRAGIKDQTAIIINAYWAARLDIGSLFLDTFWFILDVPELFPWWQERRVQREAWWRRRREILKLWTHFFSDAFGSQEIFTNATEENGRALMCAHFIPVVLRPNQTIIRLRKLPIRTPRTSTKAWLSMDVSNPKYGPRCCEEVVMA